MTVEHNSSKMSRRAFLALGGLGVGLGAAASVPMIRKGAEWITASAEPVKGNKTYAILGSGEQAGSIQNMRVPTIKEEGYVPVRFSYARNVEPVWVDMNGFSGRSNVYNTNYTLLENGNTTRAGELMETVLLPFDQREDSDEILANGVYNNPDISRAQTIDANTLSGKVLFGTPVVVDEGSIMVPGMALSIFDGNTAVVQAYVRLPQQNQETSADASK